MALRPEGLDAEYKEACCRVYRERSCQDPPLDFRRCSGNSPDYRRREGPHSFADGVRRNRLPHAEDLTDVTENVADVTGLARTACSARAAFADVNRCVYDSPAGDDRQRQFKRQRGSSIPYLGAALIGV